MTDEVEGLKRILREAPPIVAPDAARQAAIDAAMARFDEIRRSRQGTAVGSRLMDRVWGALHGNRKMHTIRLSHLLMAGTSVAVLAIVIVNTATLQRFADGTASGDIRLARPILPAPKPLEEPAPRDETGEAANKPATVRPVSEMPILAGKEKTISTSLLASPTPARGLAAESKAEADQVPAPASYHDQGRDRFTDIVANPVKIAANEPVSTFSIDADSASYSFVRGSLAQNLLPQKDAVRVEELVNYFPYNYAGPSDRSEPFKVNVSLMPTPWNPGTRLLHIGIKGFSLNGQERPKSNLVFLLDTSGSMEEPNKLPLLRNSMKMLVDTLGPEDSVAIVTYAGSAGTVLEPTKARDKARILAALDNLAAGGSTAGAEGIRQAYNLAEQNFDRTGINRVILATDGDFNVGITDPEELKSFVERKRDTGVYLSVLGFGRGNYNDELMQILAQNGNGNAAYIDTLNEARKVLVDEATATLFPIAKDVKIQVEFNPQTVSEYRLIGYETRLLNREDFNNDKVDAGEIGAGHTVTALYEITPKGSSAALNDPLRYAAPSGEGMGAEYAFVKVRYKLPNESTSRLLSQPVPVAEGPASSEASFAAAVAGFGQLLRGGQYTGSYTYDDVIALAQASKGKDEYGYRGEFINLVRIAKTAQALEPLDP